MNKRKWMEIHSQMGVHSSFLLIYKFDCGLLMVNFFQIWSDMNVELVSQKSVRLTAIDSDGQVRIYLVTVGAFAVNSETWLPNLNFTQ